jgi:hypothetical protein
MMNAPKKRWTKGRVGTETLRSGIQSLVLAWGEKVYPLSEWDMAGHKSDSTRNHFMIENSGSLDIYPLT